MDKNEEKKKDGADRGVHSLNEKAEGDEKICSRLKERDVNQSKGKER